MRRPFPENGPFKVSERIPKHAPASAAHLPPQALTFRTGRLAKRLPKGVADGWKRCGWLEGRPRGRGPRLVDPGAGRSGPRPVDFDVRIAHAATADMVREALRGAEERLAEHGATPQAYLRRVLFYDGSKTQPRCQERKGVLAV